MYFYIKVHWDILLSVLVLLTEQLRTALSPSVNLLVGLSTKFREIAYNIRRSPPCWKCNSESMRELVRIFNQWRAALGIFAYTKLCAPVAAFSEFCENFHEISLTALEPCRHWAHKKRWPQHHHCGQHGCNLVTWPALLCPLHYPVLLHAWHRFIAAN